MDKSLELIQGLIKDSEEINYRNDKKDVVQKRADMLIRKIFGDKSHYLADIKSISWSPSMFMASTPDSVFENHYHDGKQKLLNLLKVIAEDIQLDSLKIPAKTSGKSLTTSSKNVFVVHGHNEEMKQSVARALEKLKLNPIILHEQASRGKTIIEKFTDNSEVIFAIVLLSADDVAYNKSSSPDTAKFRARQNVILELGYFLGKIGRERVLALHEEVKDLEIPSDYNGVFFVPFDKSGKWKFDLVKELKALDIDVDANAIL